MRLFLLLSLTVSILFVSCIGKQTTQNEPVTFPKTEPIVALDSINLDEYDIFNPRRLVILNDSLWIVLGDGDEDCLCLLDASGSVRARGIRIGQGPNELLELTSLHRSSLGVIVYDARKGVIYALHCQEGNITLESIASKLVLLDDACPLVDGTVLEVPVVESYSYALLNADGIVLDSLKYFPDKPENISDFTHRLACTGRTAVLPFKKRFARTLVYDGGIDFFRFDSGKLEHLARQQEFPMDYEVISATQLVPTFSKTSRVGYRSLTASDEYYYALFSDERVLNHEQKGCREIHSFTSEGMPWCKYVLDRNLFGMAVKADDSIIYGIGKKDDDSSMLYVYRIDPV